MYPRWAGLRRRSHRYFRPWNYHQNRPILGRPGADPLACWTTLPYNAYRWTQSLVYPSVSIVGGFGLRLPPLGVVSEWQWRWSSCAQRHHLGASSWWLFQRSPVARNYRPIPAVLFFGLIGQFGCSREQVPAAARFGLLKCPPVNLCGDCDYTIRPPPSPRIVGPSGGLAGYIQQYFRSSASRCERNRGLSLLTKDCQRA